MGKEGEIEYLKAIGEAGRVHALNKPFSDPNCWMYFLDIGGILSFLPEPPAKLLDLGAGSGWTSIFFAKRGYEVTSQDIAAQIIRLLSDADLRAALSTRGRARARAFTWEKTAAETLAFYGTVLGRR